MMKEHPESHGCKAVELNPVAVPESLTLPSLPEVFKSTSLKVIPSPHCAENKNAAVKL